MAIFFDLLLMLGSLYLMVRVTDLFFVESIESIARRLKLPEDVAGATLMAFGSSAPEIFVGIIALLRPAGQSQLGLGAIVGSAMFNLLVIVGVTAFVRPTKLHWQPVSRDLFFYFIAIFLLLITFLDGEFTPWEGIIFLGFYCVYLVALRNWRKLFPYPSDQDVHPERLIDDDARVAKIKRARPFILNIPDKLLGLIFFNLNKRPGMYVYNFLLAVLILAITSFLLVEASVSFASIIGLPEVVIGLTIVAAGTSMPDLISSLIAAKMGRSDMAIANAIASCIIDIVVGIGLPVILLGIFIGAEKIIVDADNLINSVILLAASLVFLALILLGLRWRVGRISGLVLISTYVAYIIWHGSSSLG
jgi:K+-dependent Na+/Ca+ exchanger-like protein